MIPRVSYLIVILLIQNKLISQTPNLNPNRDYLKHWFWGYAIAGVQPKTKLSFSNYYFNQKPDSVKSILANSQAGLAFGLTYAYRLGRNWEIKSWAMLHLYQRTLNYEFFNRAPQIVKIETASGDFPINVKYRSAMPNNTRMYIVGGVRYSYDFYSNQGKPIGNIQPLVASKKHSMYYEYGAGFEFRLQYVDVGIEFKMSNAITNQLVAGSKYFVNPNNIYNRCLEGMRSRLFSVTIFASN